MPPSKSGIADYSAALVSELEKLVDITIFDGPEKTYNPAQFDIDVYHVGNNPFHTYVYEAALRRPGVVVMHEANLHHLIADYTISRGDWDAYMAEVALNGTPRDVEFSLRVRALEAGPDYEGVKMTRRILNSARGVVVHSQFMVDEMRDGGFAGPVARIPHGSWIPEADRLEWRDKLGLDATTPLIGAFGFIKPYKRIAESLRAMRRLVRVAPEARMILVGEPHPEFPIHDLIRSLDIEDYVRVLGFTPIEHFTGYMSACDIILNLRYPTVGESSGSMLRALGLAKAVLVSDIGSFREFPDSVCLKVPVGAGEEDLIFEYLNLLVSRPELARSLGETARDWVSRECNWPHVADQYARFIEAVYCGASVWQYAARPAITLPSLRDAAAAAAAEARPVHNIPFVHRDVERWAEDKAAGEYIDIHKTRLLKTLEMIPPGGPEDAILEMGIYFQITPSLKSRLGYGRVFGCYYGEAGNSEIKTVVSTDGQEFACPVAYFDAEKDRFPYEDDTFSTVLCCELIEHLFHDPMFMMSEINRILKPGGHLVLTTPNIASFRALSAILNGYHPGFFSPYIKPGGAHNDHPRHNREYTPDDIYHLFECAGLEVVRLETGEFRDDPHPDWGYIRHLLADYRLPEGNRGDGIYAVGRKSGPVRDRWPVWLYY
ncbi:MAG TPA: glycosyltransferase [Bryobacteraceae bacterium]|jgi:glycosyltransferase involved in cell wall biosynthesis/SAM-dependent methyltransferase